MSFCLIFLFVSVGWAQFPDNWGTFPPGFPRSPFDTTTQKPDIFGPRDDSYSPLTIFLMFFGAFIAIIVSCCLCTVIGFLCYGCVLEKKYERGVEQRKKDFEQMYVAA